MSEIDYAARVAKGAALLDEKRPGWERELDLETLDIRSGYSCVTAQLSGVRSWYTGMGQLGLNEETYAEHGFNTAPSDGDLTPAEGFDALNALWKDLISKRLAPEPADG